MKRICGVDEAGRGPLAGPVVAAAVILDSARSIEGLADSKKLSAARREKLAIEIRAKALAWHVAEATVEEIDTLNILQATRRAFGEAFSRMTLPVTDVLVDAVKDLDIAARQHPLHHLLQILLRAVQGVHQPHVHSLDALGRCIHQRGGHPGVGRHKRAHANHCRDEVAPLCLGIGPRNRGDRYPHRLCQISVRGQAVTRLQHP